LTTPAVPFVQFGTLDPGVLGVVWYFAFFG
jgi:hypothetical protein